HGRKTESAAGVLLPSTESRTLPLRSRREVASWLRRRHRRAKIKSPDVAPSHPAGSPFSTSSEPRISGARRRLSASALYGQQTPIAALDLGDARSDPVRFGPRSLLRQRERRVPVENDGQARDRE